MVDGKINRACSFHTAGIWFYHQVKPANMHKPWVMDMIRKTSGKKVYKCCWVLEELQGLISDHKTLLKLSKLATYISNNQEGLVDYGARKREGLPYTSNIAEMTVNTLINDRQKGKQKMLWSREGGHNVLQIRSSIFSGTWKNDWKKLEDRIYKKAA